MKCFPTEVFLANFLLAFPVQGMCGVVRDERALVQSRGPANLHRDFQLDCEWIRLLLIDVFEQNVDVIHWLMRTPFHLCSRFCR